MGKGSGGGGAGSGAISHSAYMETFHANIMGDGTALTSDLSDAMEASLGASPFAAAAAYDPDADIVALLASITTFSAVLAGLNEAADWNVFHTQAVATIDGVTEAEIVADVDAFADQLDDQILTEVLPRYESGMRNINMVVSSAFPIGTAIIEGFRNRDVAKHASAIRLATLDSRTKLYLGATEQMSKAHLQNLSWQESIMRTTIESYRIKIIAKNEENSADIAIDESDAMWDLEVFQHGGNLLAGIGGGVSGTSKGPTTAQSVLGGAMSGAAAGFQVGGPWGAAIGGVLGAAAGLLG